jgi:hypothetical protein
MAAKTSKAKANLNWIENLPEAGTVRGLVGSLAEHDAEIARYEEIVRGLKRERARMIEAAEARIARDWTPEEVAAAKAE